MLEFDEESLVVLLEAKGRVGDARVVVAQMWPNLGPGADLVDDGLEATVVHHLGEEVVEIKVLVAKLGWALHVGTPRRQEFTEEPNEPMSQLLRLTLARLLAKRFGQRRVRLDQELGQAGGVGKRCLRRSILGQLSSLLRG
jgi:hypothetical protein